MNLPTALPRHCAPRMTSDLMRAERATCVGYTEERT